MENEDDLIAFAKKRRHIQYLTLQHISHVTAVGLLATIRTLDSLIELLFSDMKNE